MTAAETTATPKKSTYFKTDIDSLLVPGEKVVHRAVISPFIYWQTVAVFILAMLIGVWVTELGMLLAVVAFVMFSYVTVKKEILLLVLTNKRMLVRYGILQVDVVDMRFSKIESMELERMPTSYLMGYSNVVIMGTGQRHIVIPYVSNGPEIRQAYNNMTLADDKANADD